MAGFTRNGRQLCTGIGGRFSPELLAGLSRNTHNSDKILDVIIRSSYDGGEDLSWVFDVSKINYFENQKFSCNSENDSELVFDGCDNTTIKCLKDDYQTEVKYKYNCTSNTFLPIN